ncbi:sugar phosphate isomerase/epimerase family protein [Flaviflexus huanghaiensis]|uniref:sugar phosphate isomerase/epimerase family protein n=1 Tax=Flaviflexus huanghaiensis TaxID=1111473 RepID=UPI0015FB67F9|nr:sugar phosphate isomerase/epimerase [Flaviflexus huanghaiensis]
MNIAGAPITWGVCEVPAWGHQMSPDRVLSEMRQIGLTATEFGPPGWLPSEPEKRAEIIARHDLEAVGSFFLAIMHDPDSDPVPDVEKELDAFEVAGGSCLVLAADSGRTNYDDRPVLDEAGWSTLVKNIDRIAHACERRGVDACIHPHWGTMVQNVDEVRRVLDNTSVGLCLDTGHLTCGGADVVALTRTYADRVSIVHAKDVDTSIANRLIAGELTWGEAVRAGMFAPVGQGDVDFAAIVATLDAAGFSGYYVLEQDIMLTREPAAREGPIANARASLEALRAFDIPR